MVTKNRITKSGHSKTAEINVSEQQSAAASKPEDHFYWLRPLQEVFSRREESDRLSEAAEMLRLANKLLDRTLAIVEQTEARLHTKAHKGESAPIELQLVRTQLLQLGYLISMPRDFFEMIDGLFDDRVNSAVETFLSSPTNGSAGSKRESRRKGAVQ